MLNDQKDKLCNHLEVPNRANQFQTQVVIDRSNPRAWDVLADEDHTYHLSEKEYFYYKNKWWLHSNKSCSDTLPLRKRSDFKQALSTLERLHQEAGEEPFAVSYTHLRAHET